MWFKWKPLLNLDLTMKNDAEFARILEKAEQAGVEILVYKCKVSKEEVILHESIPHFFLSSEERI